MKTTMDRAGRIVIPKAVRDSLHMTAGTVLELEAIGNELRIRNPSSEPSFVRKHGFLIHHGSTVTDLDIQAFIDESREEKAGRMRSARSRAPEEKWG